MGKIKKKILIIIVILLFFGMVGIVEEINLIAQGQASLDDWRIVVGNAITNAFKTVPNAVASFGYYIQNSMVGSLLVALTEIILCWLLVYCIIAIPADVLTKGDDIPSRLKWGVIFISLIVTILLGLLAVGDLGISGPVINETLNETGITFFAVKWTTNYADQSGKCVGLPEALPDNPWAGFVKVDIACGTSYSLEPLCFIYVVDTTSNTDWGKFKEQRCTNSYVTSGQAFDATHSYEITVICLDDGTEYKQKTTLNNNCNH